MPEQDGDLSESQNRAISILIREEIARRRISRQHLADLARISLSTLEKALSGHRPFTFATTIRLEEALGMRLRENRAAPSPGENAPEDHGAYSRASVSWIEGDYVTLRPSFGESGTIFAYLTRIAWDEASSYLAFREGERLDAAFTQAGAVSIPNMSGHVYLTTNKSGQHRLIVVSRPTISGEMYGIITTLLAGRGALLTPVSAPIALVPVSKIEQIEFGRISPSTPCHEAYAAHLRRTIEEPFAILLRDDQDVQ